MTIALRWSLPSALFHTPVHGKSRPEAFPCPDYGTQEIKPEEKNFRILLPVILLPYSIMPSIHRGR